MTCDQVYAEALKREQAHSGYRIDTAAMQAAAGAGLVDGDRIALGGDLVATIEGDMVQMSGSGDARVPMSSLSTDQVDLMRVLKAAQAGRRGTSMGGF